MDESVTQPVTSHYTDNASPKLSAIYKGQVKMYLFRRNVTFYGEELSALAQPPSWRTTLVGCRRLLTQYPPYCRPFRHPQREDELYRGDSAPLIIVQKCIPIRSPKLTESNVTANYKPHYLSGNSPKLKHTSLRQAKTAFFNFFSTVLFTVIQQSDTKPIQSVSVTWTLLTYFMGQSLSEATRFLASQEIPWILWSPKVPYRVYKCNILSQINPVHGPHPTS